MTSEIVQGCVFCAEPLTDDQITASFQLDVSNGAVGWYTCHARCFEAAAHDPIDITTPAERSLGEEREDPGKIAAVDRLHLFWDRWWSRLDQRLTDGIVTPEELQTLAHALEREARSQDALAD